jgi:hypothetical protein
MPTALPQIRRRTARVPGNRDHFEVVIPGLYASAPQALSFAPSAHVRAFLLQRPQGNLLIYSAETVADDPRGIDELGGISRQYLNHWHEAAFGGGDRIASTFGAPLSCHESDLGTVSETTKVAGTFSLRHMQGDTVCISEFLLHPSANPGAFLP